MQMFQNNRIGTQIERMWIAGHSLLGLRAATASFFLLLASGSFLGFYLYLYLYSNDRW